MPTWKLPLFVFQATCVLVSFSQDTTIDKLCKADSPGHCYTLYKSTAGPLTWTQAQQSCLTYNETIATVSDMDTQQLLKQLIQSNGNAWLAGKVDNKSVSWQTISRVIYPNAHLQSAAIDSNCGFLKVDDTGLWIFAGVCTDSKQPLCSYPSGSTCEKDDRHVGSLCLHQLSDAVTWYSALMACKNLGYTLQRYESGLLTLNTSYLMKGTFWLDIHRHTWEWKTGKFEPVAVEYFNWDDQSGSNIPGYCMYISDNKGKWKSERCDSKTDVSYFVCENDSKTVSLAQSTTPFSAQNDQTVKTASAKPSQTRKGISSKLVVIISVVVGLVCVMLIVFFVVWCTVKRKSTRHSQESFNGAHGVSCSMSPIGRNEHQGNIYDDAAIVPGRMNRDAPYVYHNNASDCTTAIGNGHGDAQAENERNDRSARLASSGTVTQGRRSVSNGRRSQGMKSVEQHEVPVDYVYAKINKDRKRQTGNEDVMIVNAGYQSG